MGNTGPRSQLSAPCPGKCSAAEIRKLGKSMVPHGPSRKRERRELPQHESSFGPCGQTGWKRKDTGAALSCPWSQLLKRGAGLMQWEWRGSKGATEGILSTFRMPFLSPCTNSSSKSDSASLSNQGGLWLPCP